MKHLRRYWFYKMLDKLFDFLVKGEQKMRDKNKSNVKEVLEKLNGNVLHQPEFPTYDEPDVYVDPDMAHDAIKYEEDKVRSNIKEIATDRLHIKELSNYAESLDEEEAAAMIKGLVHKYPDIIFTTLMDEFEFMKQTLNNIGTMFKEGK